MGLKDFRFYLAVLLRRLPLLLGVVLTVSIAGGLLAYLLPPVYRASAKILVEAPKISANLAPSTVVTNPVEQLQIYQQEITTRENLLALVQELDVYRHGRRPERDADIVDDMRKRTNFDLVSDTRNDGGATIFSVSFDDRDPRIAADVVNRLAALILQKNVRVRTGQATETLQFFGVEVSRLNGALKELDSKILSFTNDHRDALPDSLDFRRMQQSSQQERLQMLEWEEAGLRNRRNNLVQMFEATGGLAKGSVALTPEQQTLQDLQRTLSDQLVLFSETSPNIVALKARIAALAATIRATAKAAANAGPQAGKSPSELDFQLSDIDQRLNFITRERTSIDKNLVSLAQSIAATPDNAMVLNSLQRNRANVQAQYDAAVRRYAEASTGKEIEVDSKGERFSIVEPAVPPHSPVWPKRKRLALGSVAAGLALAGGLILLLELLNQSIRRPAELVEKLQIQPLATIPFIEPRRQRPLFFRQVAGLTVIATLGQLLWVSSAGRP